MIMHSHRKNGVMLMEHCRVMVKDNMVCMLQNDDSYQTFINVPFANVNALILGSGTSITNSAARMLSEEGTMIGFVGGGGTPLFLASQSEYRPTEYLMKWIDIILDENVRLEVAKYFQLQRCKNDRLIISNSEIINKYENSIKQCDSNQSLLGYEGTYVKSLFAFYANEYNVPHFKRDKRIKTDIYNTFVTRYRYVIYGLASVAIWSLGIPPSLPVIHGSTRKGGLVFDVADLYKNMFIGLSFKCANENMTYSNFRKEVLKNVEKYNVLNGMFDTLKYVIENYGKNNLS